MTGGGRICFGLRRPLDGPSSRARSVFWRVKFERFATFPLASSCHVTAVPFGFIVCSVFHASMVTHIQVYTAFPVVKCNDVNQIVVYLQQSYFMTCCQLISLEVASFLSLLLYTPFYSILNISTRVRSSGHRLNLFRFNLDS